MREDVTALGRVREVERMLQRIRRELAWDDLSVKLKELWQSLGSTMYEVRLAVRDYEFADTRAEQQALAKEAIAGLRMSEMALATLSQQGLLGPVDAAQLSALIDTLRSELEA